MTHPLPGGVATSQTIHYSAQEPPGCFSASDSSSLLPLHCCRPGPYTRGPWNERSLAILSLPVFSLLSFSDITERINFSLASLFVGSLFLHIPNRLRLCLLNSSSSSCLCTPRHIPPLSQSLHALQSLQLASLSALRLFHPALFPPSPLALHIWQIF